MIYNDCCGYPGGRSDIGRCLECGTMEPGKDDTGPLFGEKFFAPEPISLGPIFITATWRELGSKEFFDNTPPEDYTVPMTTNPSPAQEHFQDSIDGLIAVISDTENVIDARHIVKMRKAVYAMRMAQQYGMEPI